MRHAQAGLIIADGLETPVNKRRNATSETNIGHQAEKTFLRHAVEAAAGNAIAGNYTLAA
jgi:hypothetical protein